MVLLLIMTLCLLSLTYLFFFEICNNHITDSVATDEGVYTCVASSRSGKATWSATLKLESRTNPNAHFFRSPEPTSLPGPPSRPLVVNSTHNSITISWNRNNKIGSSSLLGYQVEYLIFNNQTGKPLWVRLLG